MPRPSPPPPGPHWVGTWACSPQLTEPHNLPPAPGLDGRTLRQVLRVSLGGTHLRLRLSNLFGDRAVSMTSVHLALSAGGSAIDARTDAAVTFAGAPAVTIPAGETVVSDVLDFVLAPLETLAVTIVFGDCPADITGHPGSRTTSYVQAGVPAAAAAMPEAARVDHWYFIAGIDVLGANGSAAVVTLGDSITDGHGSTTNGQDRWPDILARRLQSSPATRRLAVLNHGIGGNTVLGGGLGPTAQQRFERDVLDQTGVRWLIVLEGVNDLGLASDANVADVARGLMDAYRELACLARRRGIRVYGVPILPFCESFYDTPAREAGRQAVNDWIRSSGTFDAVIDLDAVVRDPAKPSVLLPAYDCGDHLHLNAAGYRAMGDAIALALFSR